MKNFLIGVSAVLIMLVSLSGCRKDIYGCTDPSATNYNSAANVNNGNCRYMGSIVFWTPNTNYPPITVTINGQTSVVTGSVVSGSPYCGLSGCANFTLPEGSYSYSASNGSSSWNNTAVVSSTVCNAYELN